MLVGIAHTYRMYQMLTRGWSGLVQGGIRLELGYLQTDQRLRNPRSIVRGLKTKQSKHSSPCGVEFGRAARFMSASTKCTV